MTSMFLDAPISRAYASGCVTRCCVAVGTALWRKLKEAMTDEQAEQVVPDWARFFVPGS
jgi:hypothetical protein